jgi:hypothetical protein
MKAGAIAAIIGGVFLGLILLVGIAAWSIFGSAYNTANNSEINIEGNFKDLQNVKSSYTMKIREMAQVPEMYAEKLKEVVGAAMEGRYGADGSKAVFQMITEQNPTVDPTMYNRVQQVMEAGRNDFQQAQTKHNDILIAYKKVLTTFPNNIVYGMLGYPKLDLSKYQIIIASETRKQFETGTDEKINLKDGK